MRYRHKKTKYTVHFLLALVALSLLFAACGGSEAANGSTGKARSEAATRGAATANGQSLTNEPIVYVAMGASDAVGVGSNQPGSQGYVPLLAGRLPKGSHVVNLGISGIRLHEAMQKELPVALSVGPKLITIWLVANDFVGGVPYDSYMQDLDSLLKQLHNGTSAKIVMANLPDLTLVPALSHSSAAKKAQVKGEIVRWNTRIASLANQYRVTLVDLSSHDSQLTAHPEYVSGDGFHPSPAGYVQLSNYFWTAITGQ
jgi:lysophospholipase L1-like esterase